MTMMEQFIGYLEGHFNNSQQLERFKKEGITGYPEAEHRNSVCNNRITGLPTDFQGVFVLEESYYTTDGKMNPMPHLFLFTQAEGGIKLTSYDMPEGYTKENFTYENLKEIAFESLKISEKFTPIIYHEENGAFAGNGVSIFSPVLKFKLEERFDSEVLEVSETFEVNGKRTFGYDLPLEYRRVTDSVS